MVDRRATLILLLILCSLLVYFPDFHIVEANFSIPLPEPAFVIRSDGSVDPSTAPIHRDGNLYTFTDNIVGYTIIVEKDDIILDGGGYTLRGYGSEGNFTLKGYADPTGILIMQQNGVTVRNMKISGFSYGIKITNLFSLACRNNILENNLVTDNYYGVYMSGSWYTVLKNNSLNNNVRNFYVYDFVTVLPPASDIYVNDIDSSNKIDGRPIIYLVNEHGKTVPSDAGYVALVNCTNMTVQNLDLAHNGQGIVLISTTNSLITNNHVINTDWGIFAHNSSNTVITENNLETNDIGIEFHDSSNSSISLNNLTRNRSGVSLVSSQNNVIFGNNITRNTGNGMWLSGLRNSTVEQNIITENDGDGVSVYDSYNNRIVSNTIASSGYYGVKIWEDSSENMISENLITNNKIGIRIQGCVNNSIIGNMITENNVWGLQLAGTHNVIYHNSFLHNHDEEGLQVLVSSEENMWDNATAGNYWSDYEDKYPNATELGSSGIWNTPYVLDESNQDNYPLMEHYIIPEFPSWTSLLVMLISVIVVAVIYRQRLPKQNQGKKNR